jgi:hypothetical protein
LILEWAWRKGGFVAEFEIKLDLSLVFFLLDL